MTASPPERLRRAAAAAPVVAPDPDAPDPPAWLTADDPEVVWTGALGSLDEALQGLAGGGATAAASYVVPRVAAAAAGFAFLDREGFAAVGKVIMAPLAEVTYALLRACAEGSEQDIDAATLGVCCALDVDLADMSA